PAAEGRSRGRRRCQGHGRPRRKGKTTGSPAHNTSRATRHGSYSRTGRGYRKGERIHRRREGRRDRLVGVHRDDTRTSPAAAPSTPAGKRRAASGRGGQGNNAVDWKISLTGRPAGNATGTTGHRTVSGRIDR